MISDSELEDFEAAIVAAGFEVDDFNVVPHKVDESIVIERYGITGTVTVHRISTDITEIYTVGFDSIWTQAFEADLQAGNFGQP